jgi:hypothetical protein
MAGNKKRQPMIVMLRFISGGNFCGLTRLLNQLASAAL